MQTSQNKVEKFDILFTVNFLFLKSNYEIEKIIE